MTLIVILNAVLAILIVSVIVALHTAAILADGRHRGRRPPVAPRPRALNAARAAAVAPPPSAAPHPHGMTPYAVPTARG
jgi:hypothetical protein